MLTRLAQSPKAVSSVQNEVFTFAELADELHQPYSRIYAFIRRHNKNHPEARIMPVRRATTGNKLYIRAIDVAIIRDAFLHPEKYEENAWD